MSVVKESSNPCLLSVIIPISKMSGRLQNLNHTISNIALENGIQIILVHDVQDENTGPELDQIVRSYKNRQITLVEKFIGSPGGARNLGLEYARGTWVNFVDSDDIYFPSNLVEILRSIESTNASAVISNYETVDSVTKSVVLHEHQENLTRVALRPGIWRWTFNAAFIGDTRFSNLSMGEDQKFLYEFCKEKQKILFDNQIVYRYTINQELQLTNQKKSKQDLSQVLSEVLKIRKFTQTNYDEFTETILIKLFASSMIHSKLKEKVRIVFTFTPVLNPTKKVRLRLSKLKLRNWFW